MPRLLPLLLPCLLCAGAAAQEPVREAAFERLTLLSVEEPGAWYAAEATMSRSAEHALEAGASLHFLVEVDYFGGEEAYPIGWPRTNAPFAEPWQRDWSDYDLLRLRIRAHTSRDALPPSPLGLILHTPDRDSAYNRTLTELEKDRWVTLEIPLSQIPRHTEVTRIQFFVAEANYQHGDVVGFHIGDISLLRHAEPTVSGLELRPSVTFSDAGYISLAFHAAGILPDVTVPARASLLADGAVLLSSTREVTRGPVLLALELAGAPLPEGHYAVQVRLGDGETQEAPLRVVSSPWAD